MHEKEKLRIESDSYHREITLAEKTRARTANILYEETSLRTENAKHFRTKSGSHIATVYNKAIHTRNKETGEFEDIHHGFEDNGNCYQACMPHFKAKFPKENSEDNFTIFEKGNCSVTWKYLPQIDRVSSRSKARISESQNQFFPAPPRLIYDNVEKMIDMEYCLTDDGIKENIILVVRPQTNVFRFELILENLRAELSAKGTTVSLFNTAKESNTLEMVMPAIVMKDDAGVLSQAAHYELVQKDGKAILSIVIDPDWLYASERLYPVVIDPQLVVAPSGQYSKIVQISDDGEKETSPNIWQAGYDASGHEHQIYFEPTFPELPIGAKVLNASILLYQSGYSGEAEYSVCKVGSPWDPSTISWNNRPSGDSIVGTLSNCVDTQSAVEITSDARQGYRMDTTASKLVYSNENGNYGYVVKFLEGSHTCADPYATLDGNYLTFAFTGERYTYTYVEYMLVDDYADHQKHETFDAMRAGNGSINLFTGKMIFSHTDVASTGGMLPLSISHLYRSDHEEIGYTDTTFGKGWRISAAQTLAIKSNQDIIATYTDAQGRHHYFDSKEHTEGGKTVYYDTAGLGLKFDGSNVITDEKDNKMTFANGKISSISDTNNNSLSFKYNGTNLESVTDALGRTATFNYGSGKLQSIVVKKGDDSSSSRTTTFTYDSNNRLIKITYADGQFVSYGYSGSELTSVVDISGIAYDIVYTSVDNDRRVSSVIQKGTKTVAHGAVNTLVAPVLGGGFDIEYRAISAAVKDRYTNIRTVYMFDDNGRVVSSYEDIRDNTKLPKSALTNADLGEYQVLMNRANEETAGKYVSAKASLSGPTSMHPNLLEEDSFEAWGLDSVCSYEEGVVNESYLDGYHSYRLNQLYYCREIKLLQRTVQITTDSETGKPKIGDTVITGNMLVFSAWAKASAPVNTVASDSRAKFELHAKLYFSDGTYVERKAQYDCGYTDWQFAAVPLAITEGKTPTSVVMKFRFNWNNGSCLVSNLRLASTRATYQEIKHNEYFDGNNWPKTIYKSNGLRSEIQFYDDNMDLVRTFTPYDHNGSTAYFISTAVYDEKHQLTNQTDFRNLSTLKDYDDFGNVTRERTMISDLLMISQADYNQNTGRLEKEYDPRNHEYTTNYQYDAASDQLYRRTDPNGQLYEYAHNKANDLPLAVCALNELCNCDISNEYIHDCDYLTRVKHNGFFYDFAYDIFGRQKSVKAAGNTLIERTYTDGEESTVTSVYGNGWTSVVTTDSRGNPIKKTVNGTVISTAEYDEVGNIVKLVDKLKGMWYTYKYDAEGNLATVNEHYTQDGLPINVKTYEYDDCNRLTSKTDSLTGHTYRMLYEKNTHSVIYPDDEVCGTTLEGKYTERMEKDGLRRLKNRLLVLNSSASTFMQDGYTYLGGSDNSTTGFMGTLTQKVNGSQVNALTYTYDRMGNIESISDPNGVMVEYTYDQLNQLKVEYDRRNKRKVTYTYDDGGNILSKVEQTLNTAGNVISGSDVSHTYTYESGWKDRLASYDGEEIVYDAIGNPLEYKGNILTWTQGRRLASYCANTFVYGADGIRVRKNDTYYTLDGDKILKESGPHGTLVYYYGASGVIGFRYNGIDYYYRKNLQGDVIAIHSASGTCVATYAYDAWGKHLAIRDGNGNAVDASTAHIANINPFRYRGYYFDRETNLYYLQTRYYDPDTGRFLNADAVDYLGEGEELRGYNLFTYCSNRPIHLSDPTGKFLCAAIGATVGFLFGAATALAQEKSLDEIWASAINGAVSGGIAGLAADVLLVTGGSALAVIGISAGAGALGSFAGSLAESAYLQKDFSSSEVWEDAFISGIWGGVFGAIGGAIAGPATSMLNSATQHAGKKALAAGITVGYAIKKLFQKELQEFATSVFEEFISNFTSWYSQEVIEEIFDNP